MFKSLVLLLLVLSLGCTKKQELTPEQTEVTPPQKPVGNYFPNMKGCFLLYNLKTNTFDKVIGEDVCKTRLSACSTFKVPLAVMAFDSGVLKDENEVYKWDGKKNFLITWNQDTDAKMWMANSTIWFSQRLTPKIGQTKIEKYLTDFKYGNADMSAGLTTAWLMQPSDPKGLKITAYEEVEFLKNLWTNKLPASQRAMDLTKLITYLETSPKGFKLNGKTGSNFYDKDPNIRLGWFVAHIEKGDKEYIAVTNFSDLSRTSKLGFGGLQAKEITKTILTDMGLW